MNDFEPEVSVHILDPEDAEPGYWERFHADVVEAAREGLAARRRARFTIEGQVVSWSRAILPVAAAAAAAALMLVTIEGAPNAIETFAGLEEVIGASLDGEQPLPYFLHSDEEVDRDVVLFAVERF